MVSASCDRPVLIAMPKPTRIDRTRHCRCGRRGVRIEGSKSTPWCAECASARRKERRSAHPLSVLLHRARASRHHCNLTLSFLRHLLRKQNGRCFWFGVVLSMCPVDNPLSKVSIDRLDNGGGYTKDNVVLSCQAANFARNSYSVGEFRALIASIELRRAPVSAPASERRARPAAKTAAPRARASARRGRSS